MKMFEAEGCLQKLVILSFFSIAVELLTGNLLFRTHRKGLIEQHSDMPDHDLAGSLSR